MIEKQILQNTIEGIKAITRTDLCVLDVKGKVQAGTVPLPEYCEALINSFILSPADSQSVQGYQFFKIYDDEQLEYVVLAFGESDDVFMVGKLSAFQLESLTVAYRERFDKDNYVKNLLLDNLLLVDIYNRAKKLHIDPEVKRVVFLIETAHERDNSAMEAVRNLLSGRSRDFITAVDEKYIIVVRQLREKDDYAYTDRVARTIRQSLSNGKIENVRISYGSIVSDIKDVSRSYKEAKMAMEVEKIFYHHHDVVAYNKLGIGRLIYQLPMPLCHTFMAEVFGEEEPDYLDEEMLTTIDRFFATNLNVSETARQLFIHRNTLVYRLDKLQKSTNLDIRNFDDAATFKIALMVLQYVHYMDRSEGKDQ